MISKFDIFAVIVILFVSLMLGIREIKYGIAPVIFWSCVWFFISMFAYVYVSPFKTPDKKEEPKAGAK